MLLTNADAYGSEAAAAKLSRGLAIISAPAPGMKAADPGTCQRAELLLQDLIAEHETIDRLNGSAPEGRVVQGRRRIFIQAQAYTIDADGKVEPIPEADAVAEAAPPPRPPPPKPQVTKQPEDDDEEDVEKDGPEPQR